MKKKIILFCILIYISFQLTIAQSYRVSGTVTESATGQPLPGVTIQVKGTLIGTATNKEGTYSLDLPDQNAILVFSSVGFVKLEIPIEGKSIMITSKTKSRFIVKRIFPSCLVKS